MPAPLPSQLDSEQILQRVFDEDTGQLRTSAEATIINADIDVSLDAAEDNVEIKSAAGVALKIETNGSINVKDIPEINTRLQTLSTNNSATDSNTLRTSSNITDESGAAFTNANYLPVGQDTHDNLNVNANVQVSNADITALNPIPTYEQFVNRSIYGDKIITNLVPVIIANAIYGFTPSNFRNFLDGSGTSGIANNEMKVFSGTTLASYGSIQSFRSLNHRAGTGSVVRMSGRFETPAANTWSGMGAFTISDELSFGYSGTTFGIWHRYQGKSEVRTLTINTPASGPENATLVLNGVSFTIPLTAGTVQHNAYQIAEYIEANSLVFEAAQNNNTVVFNAFSDGDKNLTYSFTSATATATFVRTTAGVTKTSTHIPQSSWNGIPVDVGFDPTKGNIYQIVYENGYSDINFYIQNESTGNMLLAHVLHWNNLNTITNMINPSLHLGAYATAIGATTGTNVYISHISGYSSGSMAKTRNPRATNNTKSIATTQTNLLCLRNRRVYNTIINQVEIEPVFLTLSNDGTKTAVFNLYTGGIIGAEYNFQNLGNFLVSEIDVLSTTVTNGVLIGSFTVAKGQTVQVDLNNFSIRIPPTLILTITGNVTSGSAADLTASITWYEDV